MPPVARRHTGTGGFETRPYVAPRLAGNTKPNPDPAGAGFRPALPTPDGTGVEFARTRAEPGPCERGFQTRPRPNHEVP